MEVNRATSIFLIAKQKHILKKTQKGCCPDTQDLQIYTQEIIEQSKNRGGGVGGEGIIQPNPNLQSQGLPISSIKSRKQHLVVKDETISRLTTW